MGNSRAVQFGWKAFQHYHVVQARLLTSTSPVVRSLDELIEEGTKTRVLRNMRGASSRVPTPPREVGALFCRFMGLNTDEEIKSFAADFGLLGKPVTGILDCGAEGDPIDLWGIEIRTLNLAVDALEQVHKVGGRLSENYNRPPTEPSLQDRLLEHSAGPEMQLLRLSQRQAPHTEQRRQVIAGAYYLLNRYLRDLIRTELRWDREIENFRLHHGPISLLGAIWLDLAQFVSGELHPNSAVDSGRDGQDSQVTHIKKSEKRLCACGCGETFDVKFSRKSRRTKKFLNSECRLRAHRRSHQRRSRRLGSSRTRKGRS